MSFTIRNGLPFANSVGSGNRSHTMVVVVLLLDPFVAVSDAQWVISGPIFIME
jgi:hypothetical protein